jgi:hypothetical protein
MIIFSDFQKHFLSKSPETSPLPSTILDPVFPEKPIKNEKNSRLALSHDIKPLDSHLEGKKTIYFKKRIN